MAIRGPGTFGGDFLFGAAALVGRQHHFLHHLSDDAVGENHRRVAVFEGQFEGQVHKVGHLLHRVGCEDDEVVVAVAAAARGLVVVALRGLNGAQSRATALHVHNHAWHFSACHITNAFLHQGNADARRRGHHALARSAAAIEHIDGGHFAFCLQHHHASGLPWFEFGKGFKHLALRGDGIAEVTVASAADGSVGNGLVALHQEHFALFLSGYFRGIFRQSRGHGLALGLRAFGPVFIDSDTAVRAYDCAGRASNTCFGLCHVAVGIALVVYFASGESQRLRGAGNHAEVASLTTVGIHDHGTFYFAHRV